MSLKPIQSDEEASSMYRPSAEELWKKPKDLEEGYKKAYAIEGADLRDVLPQNVKERLDDYSNSVETELEDVFGVKEIPSNISNEMKAIMDSIADSVSKKGYIDEIDDNAIEKLKKLAIKSVQYKSRPMNITVTDIPEEGYQVSYNTEAGERVKRAMSESEQDFLFNMEMWAEQFGQLQNVENFKSSLKKAKTYGKKEEDQGAKIQVIRHELYKKYEKFGFTREEIDNLITCAEVDEIKELVPEGKEPGMHKLEIMMDVWKRYLSGKEKSKYVKLAAGIIGVGAVEGVIPILFKHMMDAKSFEVGALFAMAYFGSEAALGWVRKTLTVKFDSFINSVMDRESGLNERLSKDLVFQPGEVMAATNERGRLMTSLNRGRQAFKDILSNATKVSMPAVAGTASGLVMMIANDWRLGLFTLASAPIALAIARRIEKKLEPIIEKAYKTQDETALEVEEQINAHMEIVLSGMRDSMGPRLEKLMKRLNELSNDRSAARAGMEFRMGSLLNPAVIGGLTVAGVALRGMGVQESGKILAAIVYSNMFTGAFERIVREQANAMESCASILEMEEVFNGYSEEETKKEAARVPASELSNFSIDLKNVSLNLEDRKLINNVNLSVPAGSTVRLEGMSGHGKTTLTKLMAGYYRPTNGEVRIGGVPVDDVKKTGPESIYAHVAYLSQRPYIFDSENLQKNLEFGNHNADEQEMKEVLKELNLEERFSKNGEIDLSSSVVGLSGGEKTRLALARVLLKVRKQERGGIVFLDEPTEGLDEETESEVAEILVREKQNHPDITFVVVSHRRSFIEELEKPRGDKPGLEVKRIKIKKGAIVNE